MKKHINAGVIIVLLTLIWGAAQAYGSLDPCGVLTKEEAEAFLGEPINDPEQKDTKNPLGQKICWYASVSSSRFIQVSVIRTADMAPKIRKHGQSAAKVYSTTKENLDPLEQVRGVGDDAFWATPGLHILKGEVYVLISVGNTSRRENLDLAKRIAVNVLSRL